MEHSHIKTKFVLKSILLLVSALSVILLAGDKKDKIVNIAEKLNSGYKITFTKDLVILYNNCDTLKIDRSKLSKKEIKKIEKLRNEEEKSEREFRKKAVRLLKKKVGNKNPEIEYIKFYAILNKNKALLAAKNKILGIDSSRVLNARHSLDSIEIVMRFKILDSDTAIVKQQYNLGNLILPTWKYFTVDSLRNFLNKSVRWTGANP